MAPAVSILIPTYSRHAMLKTAVESALGQTYGNLEVLIGVDGGTPEVLGTAHSFPDPRVKVFVWKKNRGPYPVYESLLAEARGDYLQMFSDDDRMAPTFVERCIHALEASGAKSVSTDDVPWDGQKTIPDPRGDPKKRFVHPNINATIFRREALEQIARTYGGLFHRDLRAYGDTVLFYRLDTVFGTEARTHIQEPLVWNRMHDEQLSKNPRLWSLLEDVIVNRAIGEPIGYWEEWLTLLWLFKKKAEAMTKKRLPRLLH